MVNRLEAALLSLLFLSSCLSQAPRERISQNASKSIDYRNPASYAYHYRFTNSAPNHTYVATMLVFSAPTQYLIVAQLNGTWNNSRWYWLQLEMVKWSTPHLGAHSDLAAEVDSPCESRACNFTQSHRTGF